MALDMRAPPGAHCGPLPAQPDRYRVGELIALVPGARPASIETPLWEIALDHERRAVVDAALEPGAREAVEGARAAGFATAVWTNNAREVTAARAGALRTGARASIWSSRATRCARSSPIPTAGA